MTTYKVPEDPKLDAKLKFKLNLKHADNYSNYFS